MSCNRPKDVNLSTPVQSRIVQSVKWTPSNIGTEVIPTNSFVPNLSNQNGLIIVKKSANSTSRVTLHRHSTPLVAQSNLANSPTIPSIQKSLENMNAEQARHSQPVVTACKKYSLRSENHGPTSRSPSISLNVPTSFNAKTSQVVKIPGGSLKIIRTPNIVSPSVSNCTNQTKPSFHQNLTSKKIVHIDPSQNQQIFTLSNQKLVLVNPSTVRSTPKIVSTNPTVMITSPKVTRASVVMAPNATCSVATKTSLRENSNQCQSYSVNMQLNDRVGSQTNLVTMNKNIVNKSTGRAVLETNNPSKNINSNSGFLGFTSSGQMVWVKNSLANPPTNSAHVVSSPTGSVSNKSNKNDGRLIQQHSTLLDNNQVNTSDQLTDVSTSHFSESFLNIREVHNEKVTSEQMEKSDVQDDDSLLINSTEVGYPSVIKNTNDNSCDMKQDLESALPDDLPSPVNGIVDDFYSEDINNANLQVANGISSTSYQEPIIREVIDRTTELDTMLDDEETYLPDENVNLSENDFLEEDCKSLEEDDALQTSDIYVGDSDLQSNTSTPSRRSSLVHNEEEIMRYSAKEGSIGETVILSAEESSFDGFDSTDDSSKLLLDKLEKSLQEESIAAELYEEEIICSSTISIDEYGDDNFNGLNDIFDPLEDIDESALLPNSPEPTAIKSKNLKTKKLLTKKGKKSKSLKKKESTVQLTNDNLSENLRMNDCYNIDENLEELQDIDLSSLKLTHLTNAKMVNHKMYENFNESVKPCPKSKSKLKSTMKRKSSTPKMPASHKKLISQFGLRECYVLLERARIHPQGTVSPNSTSNFPSDNSSVFNDVPVSDELKYQNLGLKIPILKINIGKKPKKGKKTCRIKASKTIDSNSLAIDNTVNENNVNENSGSHIVEEATGECHEESLYQTPTEVINSQNVIESQNQPIESEYHNADDKLHDEEWQSNCVEDNIDLGNCSDEVDPYDIDYIDDEPLESPPPKPLGFSNDLKCREITSNEEVTFTHCDSIPKSARPSKRIRPLATKSFAPKIGVLKYQPPLEGEDQGGSHPFSQSLRKILQNVKNPGSIKKPRRRMKVTPIIPKHRIVHGKFAKPYPKTFKDRSLPDNTYVFDGDNEQLNFDSFKNSAKDPETLNLLKELDNLDFDLDVEKSTDVHNETAKATNEMDDDDVHCDKDKFVKEVRRNKPCPASKKKIYCPEWKDEQLYDTSQDLFCPADLPSPSPPASPILIPTAPRKNRNKNQKAHDCISAMNIVLERHGFGDDLISIKDFRKILSMRNIKKFSEFKEKVIEYFKLGKEYCSAFRPFDVTLIDFNIWAGVKEDVGKKINDDDTRVHEEVFNEHPAKDSVDVSLDSQATNMTLSSTIPDDDEIVIKEEPLFDEQPIEAEAPFVETTETNIKEFISNEPEKDEPVKVEGKPTAEDLWLEAEKEWDLIVLKNREEMAATLSEARKRAAKTKRLMREAAEKALARKMAATPACARSENYNSVKLLAQGNKISKYMRRKLLKEYREKIRVQVLIERDRRRNVLVNAAPVYSDEDSDADRREEEAVMEFEEGRKQGVDVVSSEVKIFEENPSEEKPSEEQHDEEEEWSSASEEEVYPPFIDVSDFLSLNTYHGHILPEEGVTAAPDEETLFKEPVETFQTEASQLMRSTKVRVKRLRYVHIVNKYCKRHQLNLRTAFRIRRRLRYWEERQVEQALIEEQKKSPRTMDDFLLHEVFSDILVDKEEEKAFRRKRLSLEFDKVKYWDDYDTDYDDEVQTDPNLEGIPSENMKEVTPMMGKAKPSLSQAQISQQQSLSTLGGTVVFNHSAQRYEILPTTNENVSKMAQQNKRFYAKDPKGQLVSVQQHSTPSGSVKVVTRSDGQSYVVKNLEGYQLLNIPQNAGNNSLILNQLLSGGNTSTNIPQPPKLHYGPRPNMQDKAPQINQPDGLNQMMIQNQRPDLTQGLQNQTMVRPSHIQQNQAILNPHQLQFAQEQTRLQQIARNQLLHQQQQHPKRHTPQNPQQHQQHPQLQHQQHPQLQHQQHPSQQQQQLTSQQHQQHPSQQQQLTSQQHQQHPSQQHQQHPSQQHQQHPSQQQQHQHHPQQQYHQQQHHHQNQQHLVQQNGQQLLIQNRSLLQPGQPNMPQNRPQMHPNQHFMVPQPPRMPQVQQNISQQPSMAQPRQPFLMQNQPNTSVSFMNQQPRLQGILHQNVTPQNRTRIENLEMSYDFPNMAGQSGSRLPPYGEAVGGGPPRHQPSPSNSSRSPLSSGSRTPPCSSPSSVNFKTPTPPPLTFKIPTPPANDTRSPPFNLHSQRNSISPTVQFKEPNLRSNQANANQTPPPLQPMKNASSNEMPPPSNNALLRNLLTSRGSSIPSRPPPPMLHMKAKTPGVMSSNLRLPPPLQSMRSNAPFNLPFPKKTNEEKICPSTEKVIEDQVFSPPSTFHDDNSSDLAGGDESSDEGMFGMLLKDDDGEAKKKAMVPKEMKRSFDIMSLLNGSQKQPGTSGNLSKKVKLDGVEPIEKRAVESPTDHQTNGKGINSSLSIETSSVSVKEKVNTVSEANEIMKAIPLINNKEISIHQIKKSALQPQPALSIQPAGEVHEKAKSPEDLVLQEMKQRRISLLQSQQISLQHQNADCEMMLPQLTREPLHCGRADPDERRTAAQISPIVNVVRLALCAGYSTSERHLRAAVYQLSLAWGICCRYHSVTLAEWGELVNMIGLKGVENITKEMFTPPFVPNIPLIDDYISSSPDNYKSLIIVERLVFAVDKRSREVFLPLPNWVQGVKHLEFDLSTHINYKLTDGGTDSTSEAMKRNEVSSHPSVPDPQFVELLTVVVSFTTSGQLLPGLVVFPGTLMTYRLRHSLDAVPGGRDWIISSRGGWKGNIGRCVHKNPQNDSSTNCDCSAECKELFEDNSDKLAIEEYLSRLVVGWGRAHLTQPLFLHLPEEFHYTVTGKYGEGVIPETKDCCTACSCKQSAETTATNPCPKHPHQHLVPSSSRVLQGVGIVTSTHDSVGVLLTDRVFANWGVMVRQWTQKNGALLEHTFPSFMLHYLPILLKASTVKRFSHAAGLDTFDRKKMERFNRHTDDYRKMWQCKKI